MNLNLAAYFALTMKILEISDSLDAKKEEGVLLHSLFFGFDLINIVMRRIYLVSGHLPSPAA